MQLIIPNRCVSGRLRCYIFDGWFFSLKLTRQSETDRTGGDAAFVYHFWLLLFLKNLLSPCLIFLLKYFLSSQSQVVTSLLFSFFPLYISLFSFSHSWPSSPLNLGFHITAFCSFFSCEIEEVLYLLTVLVQRCLSGVLDQTVQPCVNLQWHCISGCDWTWVLWFCPWLDGDGCLSGLRRNPFISYTELCR